VLLFEIPLPTVYHTLRLARANGVRSIVNPAPALEIDFKEMAASDYFIPNDKEAETLTGMPVDSIDAAKRCAEYLRGQGIPRVVVTLGERGSLLATPKGMTPIPAFKVQPVDSTGAGDAFIGSFAVFLAEGLEDTEALTRASLYAALSTTRAGAQKSFPNRDEFDKEWQLRG